MDDDGDDKDDNKRKSRNLSEKKRRDQFNMLINELSSMVSNSSRKMDKSTVLKSTISFLRNHNELSVRSRAHEIQEDWKPSFLSNEEFTHIILESVDGFIIVFSLSGHIIYVSGSVTSLLGHLPSDIISGPMTMFDMVYEEDHSVLYDMFSACRGGNSGKENQLHFSVHIRRASLVSDSEPVYDLVHFIGYFRGDSDSLEGSENAVSSTILHGSEGDSGMVFVGTGRLDTPQLISEMTFANETVKSEFTSRHNLDWKFLALDARATPIIGYVQLEVVGTSGYDYYHVDDLDKIVSCHEALMEKGEGTSCYYRFLTKGQQWIWLQTRYYISYHQWNSKPEFVVCTHRVISYVDVLIQSRKRNGDNEEMFDDLSEPYDTHSPRKFRTESAGGSSCRRTPLSDHARLSGSRSHQDPTGSDTHSEDSFASRSSHLTNMSVRSVRSHPQSRRHHQHSQQSKPCPLSPAQATSTYVEPHQYVTAIPLQPIITGFPVSTLPPQELMRQPPTPLTDQVKRKQQELNQLRQLMCQKEEELQQFVIAQSRYRIIPSLLNVSLPYSVPASAVSSTTQPSSSMAIPATSPSMSNPSRGYCSETQQAGMGVQLTAPEILPFHFPDQQPQLIFQANIPPQDQPPDCQ